jgi:hypothetical protein
MAEFARPKSTPVRMGLKLPDRADNCNVKKEPEFRRWRRSVHKPDSDGDNKNKEGFE